jgi:hypothetical protein
VFLEGLDEHKGGVTSLVDEFSSLSADFVSSVIDPNEVFLGGLDFAFNVFSECGGIVTSLFVGVGDGEELSDLIAEFLFLCSINFISSSLGIEVGLFKISQKLKSAINSIGGLCLHI